MWFVVSTIGLLGLMAFNLIEWTRGLEILERLVDLFMGFQGMFETYTCTCRRFWFCVGSGQTFQVTEIKFGKIFMKTILVRFV